MKGADGVVRSTSKTISLERATPSAPDSVASQHLFDGAATPPLPRRGLGTWLQPRVRQQRNAYTSQDYIPTLKLIHSRTRARISAAASRSLTTAIECGPAASTSAAFSNRIPPIATTGF